MLNSIRERHAASMDLHIQIGKRAANLARPSLKRVKKDVRVLWNERRANPSVGQFACEFQVFRPQRC